MTRPLTPDICFIGGASSLSLAIAAAAASGLSVAVVEGGSTDTTRARLLRVLALGAAAGRAGAAPDIDFARLSRHIDELATATPNSSAAALAALGVNLIKAEPRFKDRRTLVAGDVELRARRFVIATGTLPAPRTFDGLDASRCLDEDTIFGLSRRPHHLIVVGSSSSAIELAQAWRRLGSEVTVVAAAPPLAGHDPEMAAVVLRRLAAEGVTILEKATVSEAQSHGNSGVRLQVMANGTTSAIDATHLLVADRRVPNVASLDLDKARVTHDDNGISVSPALRTGNRRVYAIGDVTGERHLADAIEHQAMMIVRGQVSGRDENGDAAIPRLVHSDPPLAQIGALEAEALKSHPGAKILRWPYAENERARAEGRTEGHVKLAVDKDGRILGAAIAGANAGELIGFWSLALSKGMAVGDIAGLVLPASTFGEIGKRAAITYFPPQRRVSFGRKLAGLFRVSG